MPDDHQGSTLAEVRKPALRWEFSPQWAGWWLMLDDDGVTARRGYGPFLNEFECQCAADVHDAPFPPLTRHAEPG